VRQHPPHCERPMCRSSWQTEPAEFPVPPSSPARSTRPGPGLPAGPHHGGARQRYGSPLPDNVVERLDYELGVIGTWVRRLLPRGVDLIRFARDSGIRSGRDADRRPAAVSLLPAHRRSGPHPLRPPFRALLNPGRKQMPDIDMDFDERYRRRDALCRREVRQRPVAQVVTFSTIKARLPCATREGVGKAYLVGDRIAKAMPPW